MYENYSVLFVDDEINILSSLRRGFLEEEYHCYFAESALRAVEILEQNKVHVIVTDMRMPEMNGLDLLKHVEANYPTVIKLVLSGYTQLPQVLATINQVDIFNFITKPWSIDELIIIIRKAFDHYILQEENAKYKTLLETQNLAYQNILKRIDDVVENAKKSGELLRIVSNEMLSYGKDFTPLDRTIYNEILSKQYEIYNTLSKAVTLERKEYSSTSLQQKLTAQIQEQFPNAVIDHRPVIDQTVLLNKQMLDALISSILILFYEDLTQNELYVNFMNTSKFTISFISKNAGLEASKRNNGITIFHAKMSYIKTIADAINDLCFITLQILDNDGNLVVGFSFEEQ
jgi:YesN/AraC family two-component response regulator